MILFLVVAGAIAAAYQALALIAAFRHLAAEEPRPSVLPPVSILKPVKGLDPHFYEAIRSHALQDYPEYELLFGVTDAADPAVEEIRRLQREFPERQIRLVVCSRRAPNGKVGVLVELAAEAQYKLLLVSDSDIRVTRDYLRRIVAPIENPGVGVVTCLYGAAADHWPGRWEAIGIASDFAPSVLVAPYVGVRGFGLGSTLLFRRAQLRQIGGFEALENYLADDYQLAHRIHKLRLKVVLAKVAVETWLSGRTWGDVWRHQLRWARTVRVSRPGGYIGLPVTQASLWSLLLALYGLWWLALPLLGLRMLVGLVVGEGVLRNDALIHYFYLIPLRDLWGFGVWCCGLFGRTVEWRGEKLRLTWAGRIVVAGPEASSIE